MIFPIGHYAGVRPAVGDRGETHLVRVGRQQHRLTPDGFTVWVLAHGMAGAEQWTRREIAALATETGMADPDTELDDLLGRELLADVADPAGFARTHRMEALYIGMGNAPDRPDAHAVGIPGIATAALLDDRCYELWQWGSIAPSLSDYSTDYSTDLPELLEDLRQLMVHGCAYLDRVVAA